jgi:hypothetical protein
MKFPFSAATSNAVILIGLAGCQARPRLQVDAVEGVLSAFETANIVPSVKNPFPKTTLVHVITASKKEETA